MGCARGMVANMDELPPDARALLESSQHADDPSAAERVRSDGAVRAALAQYGVHGLPPLQGAAAASAGTGHAAKGRATSRAALAVKVGAGAMVIIGALYLGRRAMSPELPVVSPRSQPSTTSARSFEERGRSSNVELVAPVAPTPLETPSSLTAEPVVRHHERRAPAASLHKPDRRAPAAEDDHLAAELRTVSAVNELLRHGGFAAALQLLEHTESETASVLREERTALRIIARCGVSPDERARRERDQFLRASSRSVLSERVRKACADSAVERP
jgi:hypothetical protein